MDSNLPVTSSSRSLLARLLAFASQDSEKKNLDKQVGFKLVCRLIPLSHLLYILLFFVILILWSWSGYLVVEMVPFYVFLQVAIACLVIFCAVRLEIEITEQGIKAKSRLHKQSMNSRNERDWSDVHSVRIKCLASRQFVTSRLNSNKDQKSLLNLFFNMFGFWQRAWYRQGFFIIDFRSGGLLALPIAGIKSEDLEKFFLALSKYADPLALNSDVIALQRDVLAGGTICLEKSYTQMWEEELGRRFEVTNFAPLPSGYQLQDGSLMVLMQVASGGMSSVYLAKKSSGERVVLKELVVPDSSDKNIGVKFVEMFNREASILSKLDHPKIVRVFDHFVENGRSFLVLDMARGLTLRQHVQLEGALAEKTAIRITMQIAEIVSYLHDFEPPVIHRDVTPDNLVYDPDNDKITLIDFGAASEYLANHTGTLIGKQSYIPPEQFRGKAEPASDIYAIGATLHFLLTGDDPEPISQSSPASVLTDCSKALDEIVRHSTELEPSDRIGSAEELYIKLSIL